MPRSFDPARSLAARFPALAAQWHPTRNAPLTPDNTLASSPTSMWWQCAAGHEWEDKIATRTALPKWKKGDVAACPQCADFPARLVLHTYSGCGHTRAVQRRNAEKGQQRCWECGGDPDPARDAARLDRKRTSALESYHRRRRRGGPLSAEERAAQRSLVGFTKGAKVELNEAALTWWRERVAAEIYFATTVEELSGWLSVLSVPHQIVLRRDDSTHVVGGVQLQVEDLDALAGWCPRFVEKVRSALYPARKGSCEN